LTECVQTQSAVPEGYQILIESMASAAWCCVLRAHAEPSQMNHALYVRVLGSNVVHAFLLHTQCLYVDVYLYITSCGIAAEMIWYCDPLMLVFKFIGDS
jgi:hypothetical protein